MRAMDKTKKKFKKKKVIALPYRVICTNNDKVLNGNTFISENCIHSEPWEITVKRPGRRFSLKRLSGGDPP